VNGKLLCSLEKTMDADISSARLFSHMRNLAFRLDVTDILSRPRISSVKFNQYISKFSSV